MALKGMRIKAKDGRHYGNVRIVFDSQKNQEQVTAQSMLEFLEFTRLEGDPNVVRYVPHPGTIFIELENGEVRSFFDAEVHMTDGSIVYEEVKYEKELLEGTNDTNDPFRSFRQVSAQQKWCEDRGYEYRVVTDRTLYVENPTLFNNMLFISRRLRPERVEDQNMLVSKSVSVLDNLKRKGGRARVAQLIENHEDFACAEETLTAVCYLFTNGLIGADLGHQVLSYESEVWENA